MKKIIFILSFSLSLLLLTLGCQPQAEPEPDFSVISSPQLPNLEEANTVPTEPPPPAAVAEVLPTTDPNAGPSLFDMEAATPPPETPAATDTPEGEVEEEVVEEEPTETPAPIEETATTAPTAAPTATPKPASPPDEPRQGGSWDMEDGFEVWINPHGDNCSGSQVAVGWKGFTSKGQYGSSCFYLNEYGPNVLSGGFSQQVTFDFVDSQAGLYRSFDSKVGHTYQVSARLRHVHTLPPMQYHFGLDLSGGNSWEANTVQWFPWAEFREDDWITHTQTFQATGPKTTIFIKGSHSTAAQGGATYIDAIEIIDVQ